MGRRRRPTTGVSPFIREDEDEDDDRDMNDDNNNNGKESGGTSFGGSNGGSGGGDGSGASRLRSRVDQQIPLQSPSRMSMMGERRFIQALEAMETLPEVPETAESAPSSPLTPSARAVHYAVPKIDESEVADEADQDERECADESGGAKANKEVGRGSGRLPSGSFISETFAVFNRAGAVGASPGGGGGGGGGGVRKEMDETACEQVESLLVEREEESHASTLERSEPTGATVGAEKEVKEVTETKVEAEGLGGAAGVVGEVVNSVSAAWTGETIFRGDHVSALLSSWYDISFSLSLSILSQDLSESICFFPCC